jgi:hypothetical protein
MCWSSPVQPALQVHSVASRSSAVIATQTLYFVSCRKEGDTVCFIRRPAPLSRCLNIALIAFVSSGSVFKSKACCTARFFSRSPPDEREPSANLLIRSGMHCLLARLSRLKREEPRHPASTFRSEQNYDRCGSL